MKPIGERVTTTLNGLQILPPELLSINVMHDEDCMFDPEEPDISQCTCIPEISVHTTRGVYTVDDDGQPTKAATA